MWRSVAVFLSVLVIIQCQAWTGQKTGRKMLRYEDTMSEKEKYQKAVNYTRELFTPNR